MILYKSLIIMSMGVFVMLPLHAANLGTWGKVYPIAEDNLLSVIKNRLNALNDNGGIDNYHQMLIKKVEASLKHPAPITTIKKATRTQTRTHDMSVTLSSDIRDHNNKILVKKGEKINPLAKVNLLTPLLFIDGSDEFQVQWAVKLKLKNDRSKIILINGSPLDLTEQWKQPFYFDQSGKLSERLTIRVVPSRVTQEKEHLVIEEVSV